MFLGTACMAAEGRRDKFGVTSCLVFDGCDRLDLPDVSNLVVVGK